MASSPPFGSPSTLHPDDSASQTVSAFFDSNFQLGSNYSQNNPSEPSSSTLSSVPSGLLTPTAPSNTPEGTECHSQLFSEQGPSAVYSSIPSTFLTKRKSRKGYCWLPANGNEFFTNGKWKWQCARCKYLDNYILPALLLFLLLISVS